MPTPLEASVLTANRAFYNAFQERNMHAMEQVWAQDHEASCIHPGWAPLLGRQAVMASWRAILGSSEAPQIEMTDARAAVLDNTAFVVCVEQLADATISATNVFVREKGEWRLVHHHGGPMPGPRPSRRSIPSRMN